MTITGFGLDPDKAISDAIGRCQTWTEAGWKMDEYDTIPVDPNQKNPYSEIIVMGFTARIELTKEITDDRIPREPF